MPIVCDVLPEHEYIKDMIHQRDLARAERDQQNRLKRQRELAPVYQRIKEHFDEILMDYYSGGMTNISLKGIDDDIVNAIIANNQIEIYPILGEIFPGLKFKIYCDYFPPAFMEEYFSLCLMKNPF